MPFFTLLLGSVSLHSTPLCPPRAVQQGCGVVLSLLQLLTVPLPPHTFLPLQSGLSLGFCPSGVAISSSMGPCPGCNVGICSAIKEHLLLLLRPQCFFCFSLLLFLLFFPHSIFYFFLNTPSQRHLTHSWGGTALPCGGPVGAGWNWLCPAGVGYTCITFQDTYFRIQNFICRS